MDDEHSNLYSDGSIMAASTPSLADQNTIDMADITASFMLQPPASSSSVLLTYEEQEVHEPGNGCPFELDSGLPEIIAGDNDHGNEINNSTALNGDDPKHINQCDDDNSATYISITNTRSGCPRESSYTASVRMSVIATSNSPPPPPPPHIEDDYHEDVEADLQKSAIIEPALDGTNMVILPNVASHAAVASAAQLGTSPIGMPRGDLVISDTPGILNNGSAVLQKRRAAGLLNVGERIHALQQLVSPFGKTDTASVLSEAIGYIKFLQDQVQVLSSPYMKSNVGSIRKIGSSSSVSDLRSRGLCLVPMSCTMRLASSNMNIGADYWASNHHDAKYNVQAGAARERGGGVD